MKIEAFYVRTCEREIERFGFNPRADLPYIDDMPTRFSVWRAQAMLWAIEALRMNNLKLAIRHWASAREYHGRLGGTAHSALSDTLAQIQRHIEDAIEGR